MSCLMSDWGAGRSLAMDWTPEVGAGEPCIIPGTGRPWLKLRAGLGPARLPGQAAGRDPPYALVALGEREPAYVRRRKVTGPSLTRLMTIWAPKRPVSTPGACFCRQVASRRLNIGSARSGAAAVEKPGRMPLRVSAARV